MPTSDAFGAALLDLIFRNIAFPGLGGPDGLAPTEKPGFLYVALHTASPGESGDQTVNEISYAGYARVAVERSPRGWRRFEDYISPADHITFGQMTGGTGGSATHFSIGTAAEGPGMILYSGRILPSLPVTLDMRPRLTRDTTITY